MAAPFWTRHLGPYHVVVMRSGRVANRHGSTLPVTECVQADYEGPEASVAALRLLSDADGGAIAVFIYSVPEAAHVATYRKADIR